MAAAKRTIGQMTRRERRASAVTQKRGRKACGPHVSQAVHALHALGRTLREIAAETGVAASTVHNILAASRPRSESAPTPGSRRLKQPIRCRCGLLIDRLPCVRCAAREDAAPGAPPIALLLGGSGLGDFRANTACA